MRLKGAMVAALIGVVAALGSAAGNAGANPSSGCQGIYAADSHPGIPTANSHESVDQAYHIFNTLPC